MNPFFVMPDGDRLRLFAVVYSSSFAERFGECIVDGGLAEGVIKVGPG